MLVFALVSFGSTALEAALATFAKLGDITGESTDARHVGESDVLSWSWGMTNPPIVSGSGADGGTVKVRDLTIVKRVDSASPKLLQACANDTPLNRAVLTLRQLGGNSVVFYRYVLENVRVTSVTHSSGEDQPVESVSLAFTRVGAEYISITPLGTPGDKNRFAWDLAANREGGVTFPEDTSTDTDSDGLPDSWELEFGLDPSLTDASEDADGDGATNREEFLAGTAPNSRDSVFKAHFNAPGGDAMGTLTWTSSSGLQYRVLVGDRLDGDFQIFGTYPSAGDRTTSIILPANLGTRFFRVIALPTR